jgi:hypothetical protein
MDWLRKLVGRGPQLNPEEYERVRCDRCHGTGRAQQFGGGWDTSCEIPCGKCHGKGWLMVRRQPDEPHETPHEHPSAAADAEPDTGRSLDDAPTTEDGGRRDLPHAPVAPSAPDAPGAPPVPDPPREVGEN